MLRPLMEAAATMDAIVVFRKMNGSNVLYNIIFSKTHKEAIRYDGDMELPMGVWMRLQYQAEDCSTEYLSSRHLRFIRNIAAPRYTHARIMTRSARPGHLTDLTVIFTLRAFVEYSPTGELGLVSDDIGYIMLDQDDTTLQSFHCGFEKGALVEVEFVNGSWWLRKLLDEWREGIDLSNPDSRHTRDRYHVAEDEFRTDKIHENEIGRPSSSSSLGSCSRFEHKPQVNRSKEALECMDSVVERGRPVRSSYDGTVATAADVDVDSIRKRVGTISLSSTDLRQTSSYTSSHGSSHFDNSCEPIRMQSPDSSGHCHEFREKTTKSQQSACGKACPQEQDDKENAVPKWIPPKLPFNYETMVDVTTEKPSGTKSLPAWCCIVKIRDDHIICFAPIPGVHKILVADDLIRSSLCITGGMRFLELGQWINVLCEPRCRREYDDIRPPHFSHIATKICTVPQHHPPVEPWDQRIVHNLLQIFLRCDLSVPGNVKRIQVGTEKYFLLNCVHKIPMMAPARRLEGLIDAKLTAKKHIGMWATRKKRVNDCDMFLLDSEDIIEINEEPAIECD